MEEEKFKVISLVKLRLRVKVIRKIYSDSDLSFIVKGIDIVESPGWTTMDVMDISDEIHREDVLNVLEANYEHELGNTTKDYLIDMFVRP